MSGIRLISIFAVQKDVMPSAFVNKAKIRCKYIATDKAISTPSN